MTSSKERLWHAVPDQHMYLSSLLVASNQQNIGNKGRGSTRYGRLWEMLAEEKGAEEKVEEEIVDEKESATTPIHSSIISNSGNIIVATPLLYVGQTMQPQAVALLSGKSHDLRHRSFSNPEQMKTTPSSVFGKEEEDVDTLSSLAAFSPSATSIKDKETSEEKPQEEKLEDKNELMLPAPALKGKVSRNRYKSLLMRQRESLYQIIGPKATGSVIKLMASRCGYYTAMIVRGSMKGREMKVRHYEIRAL
jgi:hypothetical protein